MHVTALEAASARALRTLRSQYSLTPREKSIIHLDVLDIAVLEIAVERPDELESDAVKDILAPFAVDVGPT